MNTTCILHWAPQSGTETGTGKAIDAWCVATANGETRVIVVSQNQPPSAEAQNLIFLGGPIRMVELRSVFSMALRTADIVHVHGAFDPGLSRVLLSAIREKLLRKLRGGSLSIVLTPHGALSDYVFAKNPGKKALYWNLIDRWLMGAVDCMICNTPVERDQLLRRMPKTTCEVVPLVISPDPAPAPGGQQLTRNTQVPPVICTVGRYDIQIKGLDLLIQAVVALNRAGTAVRLRCVGYDRQGGAAALQHYVDESGATDHVDCTGPKFGAEKEALLAGSSLFCMPSRYESFSYSLMEGLASGLPVLVGSGACVTSYFDAEQVELLVVEPTVDAWTNAIRRILPDAVANRTCVERTLGFFHRKCSTTAVGDALRALYRKLSKRQP